MKKCWAKDDAVSPVIATILMVAITVVLAAVLYVMVIGMGGGAIVKAPVGSWQSMSAESSTSATITFGNFFPDVKAMDIKLIITDQYDNTFQIWWPSAVSTNNFTMSSTNSNITAYYHDIYSDGGTVGSGDSITLYGLEPFTYYYIRVYHFNSDSVAEMAGTTQFQTAP